MRKLLVLGLLLIGSAVWAADSVPVYTPGKFQNYRTSVAVIDSAALDGTNNNALAAIPTAFHQNIRVSLKFSSASATCKVHFVRGDSPDKGTHFIPKSKSSATATADGVFTINSLYVADDLIFDSGAFEFVKIIVEAPSAGSVDIGVQ